MGLIGWIVLGLTTGKIARALLGRDAPKGCLSSLVLGVSGAIVGGWIGSLLFHAGLGSFWNIRTWALAIVGSVIVHLIHGMFTGKHDHSS